MNRRGFLTGAAKMLGGALALSVLPGEGVARAMVGEKVLWTPEKELNLDMEPGRIEVTHDQPIIVQRIIMAPNTTIQNCSFIVTQDFVVDANDSKVMIRDCYFDMKGHSLNLAPGTYGIGGAITFQRNHF